MGRWAAAPAADQARTDPRPPAYPATRPRQDKRTRPLSKGLRVLERSIFSDRQVFVRAMHRAGTMEDFEVAVYNDM